MLLSTFITKIQSYVPQGWTYYVSDYRETYNQETLVADTMQLVLPRQWPLQWRHGCHYDVEIVLWLYKTYSLRRDVEQMQQHDPYEPVEARQAMHTTAMIVVAGINTDQALSVLSADTIEFYPSPDMMTVNSQFCARVPLKVRVWNYSEGFDYIQDFKITE